MSNELDGLPYLIDRALSDGKRVVLLDQSPIFDNIDNVNVIDFFFKTMLDSFEKDPRIAFQLNDSSAQLNRLLYSKLRRESLNLINGRLRKIANAKSVPLISKLPLICNEKIQACDAITSDGYRTLIDESHYSLKGAKLFGHRLITATALKDELVGTGKLSFSQHIGNTAVQ